MSELTLHIHCSVTMKIAVMLPGVLLVIVAVALSWAHVDEPRPGDGLHPAGNPTNLMQLSRISDGNTILNIKSSIGEGAKGQLMQRPELQAATNVIGEDDGDDKARKAKGCKKSKKCSKLGGECVSHGTCIEGVTSKGCKKDCDCCIPVETTPAPPTCPPTTCPTITQGSTPTTDKCGNKLSWCDDLATNGLCESNTSIMLANCPCSCQGCYDKNERCKEWANRGTDECDNNPGYMKPVCPVSCHLCGKKRAAANASHPSVALPPSEAPTHPIRK